MQRSANSWIRILINVLSQKIQPLLDTHLPKTILIIIV